MNNNKDKEVFDSGIRKYFNSIRDRISDKKTIKNDSLKSANRDCDTLSNKNERIICKKGVKHASKNIKIVMGNNYLEFDEKIMKRI